MPFEKTYAASAPSRSEVDAMNGTTLVEFGTPWCGWCRSAQPHIATALAGHPQVRHLKIEDGSGRPLGRSFGVKLWPTLIVMRDGQITGQLVRPHSSVEIDRALAEAIPPAG